MPSADNVTLKSAQKNPLQLDLYNNEIYGFCISPSGETSQVILQFGLIQVLWEKVSLGAVYEIIMMHYYLYSSIMRLSSSLCFTVSNNVIFELLRYAFVFVPRPRP